MIYTPMTRKAVEIAFNAHMGQWGSDGLPYIFHPYHLADQMDDEISCTVAVLHDVVEDTAVTLDKLKKEFPKEVTDALSLLTHEKDMDYFEYVRAIKANPVALKVKLADIAHNSDETRLNGIEISSDRLMHWRQKYSKAKAILEE